MSTDIPEGLSEAERSRLLEKEDELAKVRDQEQRDFLDEQERMRMAREKSQRMLTEQEEKARQSEIERQEQQAQEVSEGAEELVEDVDTDVSNMFSALAYGTDFMSETDATAEAPPEMQRPE